MPFVVLIQKQQNVGKNCRKRIKVAKNGKESNGAEIQPFSWSWGVLGGLRDFEMTHFPIWGRYPWQAGIVFLQQNFASIEPLGAGNNSPLPAGCL